MKPLTSLFRCRIQKHAWRIAIVGSISVLCLLFVLSSQGLDEKAASGLPPGLPKPVINGNIPVAIPIPDSVQTPVEARPFFDHFSWQSFIALNWPAAPEPRGVPTQPNNPEVFKSAKNGTPVVWGTYKEAFELFGQGNAEPTPWNSYEVAVNPCAANLKNNRIFTMVTKGGNLLDETDEAFSFPLIDQHQNYAHYEVRFNKAQYNFIRNGKLYLMENLAKAEPVSMPVSTANPPKVGSIMLKAAWREMVPDVDDLSRFYVVDALVYNSATKKCDKKKMGLVGLHIVQKLEKFPQWIWSTFEQVDNVPNGQNPGPFSFNNGRDIPKTEGGYSGRPSHKASELQPREKRIPVQVTRLNPIPDTPKGASTRDLNKIYRNLLKGTVWQYYQLVFTQWPSNAKTFKFVEDGGIYPQDAGGAFPPNGVTNTAMETYFQSQDDAAGAGGNSCMSCHYFADQADFSWVLKGRAHFQKTQIKRGR